MKIHVYLCNGNFSRFIFNVNIAAKFLLLCLSLTAYRSANWLLMLHFKAPLPIKRSNKRVSTRLSVFICRPCRSWSLEESGRIALSGYRGNEKPAYTAYVATACCSTSSGFKLSGKQTLLDRRTFIMQRLTWDRTNVSFSGITKEMWWLKGADLGRDSLSKFIWRVLFVTVTMFLCVVLYCQLVKQTQRMVENVSAHWEL